MSLASLRATRWGEGVVTPALYVSCIRLTQTHIFWKSQLIIYVHRILEECFPCPLGLQDGPKKTDNLFQCRFKQACILSSVHRCFPLHLDYANEHWFYTKTKQGNQWWQRKSYFQRRFNRLTVRISFQDIQKLLEILRYIICVILYLCRYISHYRHF